MPVKPLPLLSPLRLRGLIPERFRSRQPLVTVVRLQGAIGFPMIGRAGMSLATKATMLERAFQAEPRAVALIVNSPGGSAVQSHLIFTRIRALSREHRTPVYAFLEDVAASGGYMIACAADVLVASPASVIGSIGVVSAGFGFQGLIEKLGIERRIHAAGAAKAMLDPFLPERQEDVARLADVQKDVHELFVDLVRTRRSGRLKGEEDILFSGAVWSGREALELGLIDEIGDLRTVMRQRFGEDVRLHPIEPPRSLLPGWLGGSGAQSLDGFSLEAGIEALEARALWARYGL